MFFNDNLILMKFATTSLITAVMLSATVFAQSEPIKMSKSGICHKPGSTYYQQTKNFTSFKTLDQCLKSGGRLPKN